MPPSCPQLQPLFLLPRGQCPQAAFTLLLTSAHPLSLLTIRMFLSSLTSLHCVLTALLMYILPPLLSQPFPLAFFSWVKLSWPLPFLLEFTQAMCWLFSPSYKTLGQVIIKADKASIHLFYFKFSDIFFHLLCRASFQLLYVMCLREVDQVSEAPPEVQSLHPNDSPLWTTVVGEATSVLSHTVQFESQLFLSPASRMT